MDFQVIETLANYGFDFARTDPGMTRSNMTGWQELATSDVALLREWNQAGYSFTSVAKRGHGFAVDIDDPQSCAARGFKPEWMDGYFAVKTPSGGLHYHGLQDGSMATLRGVVDVYKVKGDKKSGKILELKIDKASVAAPTAARIGQPGKVDGFYVPLKPVNGRPKAGLHPEFKAWLQEHAESTAHQEQHGEFKGFHPSFSLEAFLEEQECTEHGSGDVDGAFHVVVQECPHCGKPARPTTVRGGVTKFIFGGSSYGFVCHACGISTKAEHEEKMLERNPAYESWDGYMIYASDDDEILERKWNIEDVQGEPEPRPTMVKEAEIEDIPTKPALTQGYTYEPQDTGNGERLVRKFGAGIRWIAETNEWMVWDEARGWQRDDADSLMMMSKAIVKELVEEARQRLKQAFKDNADEESGAIKEARAMLAHAKASGKLERRKAMIASAGYERGIHTNLKDWDSDLWLLNVANGVIDLRTQTFRARTREDLLMKQSPVVYDPNAACPQWEAAMLKWGCGDDTWVAYVQQGFGISLTGDVSNQALFFNQGGGENGKDTAISTLRHVLGSYCRDVAFVTFAETKYGHSEHRNDLAVLAGAIRMITTSENTDGHVLDEGIIKTMTGGPDSKVTCRLLYGEPFSYTPQYKPWFMSNFEPVIKGGDWGIWRRVKKIPWDYTLKPEEKDQDFGEKLKGEAPGILNWALRGLQALLASGKKLPACQRIKDATQQYRQDMDIVGRFLNECAEFKPCHRTTGKDVYKVYQGWSKSNGQFPTQSRRFHKEFQKRLGSRARTDHGSGGLVYEGLVLKANDRGEELESWDD